DIRFEELWKEPLIEDRKESPPVDEVHYKVRRGDTPCGIAKKHHMNCQDLLALNQLDLRSIIVTGQLLALKEDVAKKPLVPEVEFIGPPPPPDLQEPQLKTLKASQTATTFGLGEDYLVNTSTIDNKKVYVMTIQSEETLGHYAEWLGLGSPSAIRELNNLNYQSYLSLGQTLVLPIRNDDQKKTFEERRIQYHKILEEEFRERYEVTGEEMYTVRRGDSESGIAKKFEIPAWLLRRFNPGVQSSTLKVKDLLRIPLLREKNNGS
ncbi:MAG: LysM peptidoglycan-binding domain-containing protein, partial [Bdellovibrionales bacterium]|nr:LysM peptidoglycan-binding domain-containing protein [Bdellovibrionales bacterium]